MEATLAIMAARPLYCALERRPGAPPPLARSIATVCPPRARMCVFKNNRVGTSEVVPRASRR